MTPSAMMASWLDVSRQESRIFIEVELKPAQGQRFQPTGFPDLGPARFESADGTPFLLVESAQSMANRLEAVCWDEAAGDLVAPLRGLPWVKVEVVGPDGTVIGETSSVLEAHRLNSPYIIGDEDGEFRRLLSEAAGIQARKGGRGRRGADASQESASVGLVDRRRLAQAVFRFDPFSVLHGVFLEKLDGRARLTRALSAFIEAEDARSVLSGGVKNDRIDPQGDTQAGFGNVPFTREEFVARRIVAYFNLDLALLRSYGLPSPATELLTLLSLWKIRRFLDHGLRLRTACDLVVKEERVVRPQGLHLPRVEELEPELRRLIEACRPYFASPPVTRVVARYQRKKGATEPSRDGDSAQETDD